MECPACPKVLDLKLERLPGVVSAESDLRRGRTTVVYDSSVVDSGSLVRAIDGCGFRAVIDRRG
jgi:copper chaperone CopZ